MKNDLVSSILAAILGVVVSYFICNYIVSNIASSSISFPTISTSVDPNVPSPDPEVFNYKSLNPTVEVYVGNCISRNQYGECVNESTDQTVEGE